MFRKELSVQPPWTVAQWNDGSTVEEVAQSDEFVNYVTDYYNNILQDVRRCQDFVRVILGLNNECTPENLVRDMDELLDAGYCAVQKLEMMMVLDKFVEFAKENYFDGVSEEFENSWDTLRTNIFLITISCLNHHYAVE